MLSYREALDEQKDVFYYVTMMNENYAQPSLPAGAEPDVIRGCYKYNSYSCNVDEGYSPKIPVKPEKIKLLGSGAILTEVIKAAKLLADEGMDVDVFSVTSWSELARDGAACQQRARPSVAAGPAEANVQALGGHDAVPFIAQQLAPSQGPIIAATDYVRAVPESVRAYLPAGRHYTTLGTDGFGRSDTRAALRDFFGVDAASIVRAAREAQAQSKPGE